MSKPLVSIVIPFYNNEATILDAVRSVFIQTYTNWELILLNDGSTDKSIDLVSKISDKRVRVVSDGINKGLVFRLNQAPLLSNADYLARMDGDDLMHPDRIAKQMELLISDNTIDLVDTGTYTISEIGEPVGIRGIEPIQYDPKKFIDGAMLLHASIIGKRNWFLNNKYDPKYIRGEDCELWARTYKTSIFKRVMEPLYIVREGKIKIANYVKATETMRKIFRTYGPQILSKKELEIKILKTRLKVALYKVFGLFNMQDYLTSKRNNTLNNIQKMELATILKKINEIELPS